VDYLVFKNFFVCLTFLTCSLNSCQKCWYRRILRDFRCSLVKNQIVLQHLTSVVSFRYFVLYTYQLNPFTIRLKRADI